MQRLNEKQQWAVDNVDGPLLILAGAGSGKTLTITHRIANIILTGKALPYQILALTFTNKAAAEMRDRIDKFEIENTNQIWMGTFHSICARILRIHADEIGYDRSFTIYDTDDSKSMIKRIMQDKEIPGDATTPADMLDMISRAKEKLQLASMFKETNVSDFTTVYQEYTKRLFASNAMDFDDLLVNVIRLFDEAPAVLERYQNRFKYILVDEYQDTSLMQYRIISIIGERSRNICVCGDDDQAIYSWRGADIQNILSFEKQFPEAHVVKLEENYRSTKNILQAANTIIENNAMRKGKTLFTNNVEGELITLEVSNDNYDEARYITGEIIKLNAKGVSYNDIAVLVRVNAQSRSIEETLIRSSVPHAVIGSIRFYERMEVKDVLSYLRLASNPNDLSAFTRCCGAPKRGIGQASIEKITEYLEFKGSYDILSVLASESVPGLGKAVLKKLSELANLVIKIQACQTVTEALELAIYKSGYMDSLEMRKNDNSSRIDNLSELMNAAYDFTQTSEDPSLAVFLENAALIASTDFIDSQSGSVKLMTVHSAKGLEFDYVFIAGMEEGYFPSGMVNTEQGIEEERRLCYVAVTRARKKVYMSYCKRRYLYSRINLRKPSRFLSEVPLHLFEPMDVDKEQSQSPAYFTPSRAKSYNNEPSRFVYKMEPAFKPMNDGFASGEMLIHPVWGKGTVVSVESSGGKSVFVTAFAGLGIKKIVEGSVDLKKAD
ncbi:MAG: UvrD-helicase domain-containing protein [Eubacteriaceae bacterium]|nr:UvrD-helicase domain-containing protein [Eubacteriaceae bacterium]